MRALFARLAQSDFRRRFRLGPKEWDYLCEKGSELIRRHAADFIAARLAPAEPPHDGKQTPMRGHPVFIAQHATATCCRGCLAKWHGLPRGRPLDAAEQARVVEVLMHWLEQQAAPLARRRSAASPARKLAKPKPLTSGSDPVQRDLFD
ncbi:DUF4186 domain-containing protein [Corticibacter populi]|uniref:DUF4186 domain-containing protein n=2 Tax=Corticibacter populi TaxID=1550736 RepID=A0A3M6QV61_9BURK|nr:DUF4186 domain-containing protein [Corticibacter populi]RZS32017.1 uncharacterized protein DUF4186 [Corticibacter populi]